MTLLRRPPWLLVLCALVAARDLCAQRRVNATGMAQAIPLLTRADPTPQRGAISEAYVTQPIIMAHVSAPHLQFDGTLDLEGWTLSRGELTTGAWGEGYIDRRHPHTYVHEAMLTAVASPRRRVWTSLSAGRGFAPFGSDDPMVRPLVKYPVNHHLAQILERVAVIGAVQAGPLILEGATFNGDEPVSPSAAPNWRRVGDSWSARLTLRPSSVLELATSRADVKSPESHLGGLLDQRKQSAYARYERDASMLRYALIEWARTDEISAGRRVFRYDSVLGEALTCAAGVQIAGRLERTERPEEQRLLDPFRSVRPLTDVAILGVSRWSTATVMIAAPPILALRALRLVPLGEASVLYTEAGRPAGLYDPIVQYGSRSLYMLSIGARLVIGHRHERMGRYGAAQPIVPSTVPSVAPAHVHSRSIPDRCEY